MRAIIERDERRLDPWTIALRHICEKISENVAPSEAAAQRLVDRYGRDGATPAIRVMGWFNRLVRFVPSTRVPLEAPVVLRAVLGGPSG